MLSTVLLRTLLPIALLFALLRTMCVCTVCAALRTMLPSMLPTQGTTITITILGR
nr:unnamed protein product [Callosobruchus analis]